MKITEQTSAAVTYTGGATAVVAGLTLNEIGVIIGIVVGVSGLALQAWYTIRRDRREKEAHSLRKEWSRSKD